LLKNKTLIFKVTVKTRQCINISILLWQHVLVLLDHLQASIQRYDVQSLHIMFYGPTDLGLNGPHFGAGLFHKYWASRIMTKICFL